MTGFFLNIDGKMFELEGVAFLVDQDQFDDDPPAPDPILRPSVPANFNVEVVGDTLAFSWEPGGDGGGTLAGYSLSGPDTAVVLGPDILEYVVDPAPLGTTEWNLSTENETGVSPAATVVVTLDVDTGGEALSLLLSPVLTVGLVERNSDAVSNNVVHVNFDVSSTGSHSGQHYNEYMFTLHEPETVALTLEAVPMELPLGSADSGWFELVNVVGSTRFNWTGETLIEMPGTPVALDTGTYIVRVHNRESGLAFGPLRVVAAGAIAPPTASAPLKPAVTATVSGSNVELQLSPPDNGGSPITGYTYQLGTEIRTSLNTQETFLDRPDGTISWSVFASNAEGDSPDRTGVVVVDTAEPPPPVDPPDPGEPPTVETGNPYSLVVDQSFSRSDLSTEMRGLYDNAWLSYDEQENTYPDPCVQFFAEFNSFDLKKDYGPVVDGFPPVALAYDADRPQNEGSYWLSRRGASYLFGHIQGIRAFKDPAILERLWYWMDFAKDHFDDHDGRGMNWVRFGQPSPNEVRPKYRYPNDINLLEEGLLIGGFAVAAWTLHLNRHVDPKYAALADFYGQYLVTHLDKWALRGSFGFDSTHTPPVELDADHEWPSWALNAMYWQAATKANNPDPDMLATSYIPRGNSWWSNAKTPANNSAGPDLFTFFPEGTAHEKIGPVIFQQFGHSWMQTMVGIKVAADFIEDPTSAVVHGGLSVRQMREQTERMHDAWFDRCRYQPENDSRKPGLSMMEKEVTAEGNNLKSQAYLEQVSTGVIWLHYDGWGQFAKPAEMRRSLRLYWDGNRNPVSSKHDTLFDIGDPGGYPNRLGARWYAGKKGASANADQFRFHHPTLFVPWGEQSRAENGTDLTIGDLMAKGIAGALNMMFNDNGATNQHHPQVWPNYAVALLDHPAS